MLRAVLNEPNYFQKIQKFKIFGTCTQAFLQSFQNIWNEVGPEKLAPLASKTLEAYLEHFAICSCRRTRGLRRLHHECPSP